jgi:nucleoside-diphosphate-sugar epimerase
MKKALITGAGGFLGRAICSELENKGYSIIAIQDSKDFFQQVDLAVEKNPEVVIHAGFRVDFSDQSVLENFNIINSKYLSEKVRDRKVHFIFISAAAVLGVSRNPNSRTEVDFDTCDQEFVAMQKSNYVKDKISVERILQKQQQNLTVLYPTTVYGKGMPAETLNALQGGSLLPIQMVPPGGTSFLMLEDFLDFLNLCIAESIYGQFLLNSANISYRNLFRKVVASTGRWKIIVALPRCLFHVLKFIPIKGKFVSSVAVILSSFGFKYYSPEKALRLTSWRPKGSIVQFFSGIFR